LYLNYFTVNLFTLKVECRLLLEPYLSKLLYLVTKNGSHYLPTAIFFRWTLKCDHTRAHENHFSCSKKPRIFTFYVKKVNFYFYSVTKYKFVWHNKWQPPRKVANYENQHATALDLLNLSFFLSLQYIISCTI
jgi:hypothetical protein